MPQITTVVINNGAGTPVAYTFSPIGKDEKGVFWWEQTTPNPSSALGAYKLSYRQTRSMNIGSNPGVSKAIYALSLPTLETLGTSDNGLTPPPTVAYQEKVRIEFDIAERSTLNERRDIRAFASNLMASAMVIANLDTLQPSYS